MAYCDQTLAGIQLDCTTSQGGIKSVWLCNYEDITKVEKDESTGFITGITMASNAVFHAYQFRKNTGSMNSTLTADETNGVNFVKTDLSLVFTKMETKKRIEMSALSIKQLAAIVLDSNGLYWMLGDEDYLSASAGGSETGTAKLIEMHIL